MEGTRIYEGEYPQELVFIPHESRLLNLILVDLHYRDHHCSPVTLLAIFKQHFHSSKLRVLSKTIVRKCFVCLGDRSASPPRRPFALLQDEVDARLCLCGLRPHRSYVRLQWKSVDEGVCMVVTCLIKRGVFLDVTKTIRRKGVVQTIRRLAATRGMPTDV